MFCALINAFLVGNIVFHRCFQVCSCSAAVINHSWCHCNHAKWATR